MTNQPPRLYVPPAADLRDIAELIADVIEVEARLAAATVLVVGPVPEQVVRLVASRSARPVLGLNSMQPDAEAIAPNGAHRCRCAGWSLPFADRRVDLIVAAFPREELRAALPGLAEVQRVLRPDGSAVVAILPGSRQPGGAGAGASAPAWCRAIEEHGLRVVLTVSTRSPQEPMPFSAAAAPLAIRSTGPTARYGEIDPGWTSLVIGARPAT